MSKISAVYKEKNNKRLENINKIASDFRKSIYQSAVLGMITLLDDDLLTVLANKMMELRGLLDFAKMIEVLKFVDNRIE